MKSFFRVRRSWDKKKNLVNRGGGSTTFEDGINLSRIKHALCDEYTHGSWELRKKEFSILYNAT